MKNDGRMPKLKVGLLLFILLSACATNTSSDSSTRPMSAHDEEVEEENSAEAETTFTAVERPDLRSELLEMKGVDQELRQKLNQQGLEKPDEELVQQIRQVDKKHAQRLDEIIQDIGRWPGRDVVGEEGAEAAWLLAQHADQHPKQQKSFLEHLRKAAQAEQVPKRHLAYLVDRIRVKEGKPQLYGTQFDIVDGKIKIGDVEAPEQLDERRAEMGLPSIEEYKEQTRKILFPDESDQTNNGETKTEHQ